MTEKDIRDKITTLRIENIHVSEYQIWDSQKATYRVLPPVDRFPQ